MATQSTADDAYPESRCSYITEHIDDRSYLEVNNNISWESVTEVVVTFIHHTNNIVYIYETVHFQKLGRKGGKIYLFEYSLFVNYK